MLLARTAALHTANRARLHFRFELLCGVCAIDRIGTLCYIPKINILTYAANAITLRCCMRDGPKNKCNTIQTAQKPSSQPNIF